MTIDRIIITGDIFRTSHERDPHQILNVLWLHNLIGASLTEATGLRPSIWFGIHDAERDRSWPEVRLPKEFFAALGVSPSLDSWARTYFDRPPDELMDLFGTALGNALVITVEMSPLLQSVLDALGLPWVDLNISPIRFLRDLCVSFRFSRQLEWAPLSGFFLGPRDISAGVARLQAHYRSAQDQLEGAVVFLGQTPLDRTLLTPEGVYSVDAAVSAVGEILDRRRLWIKPHPLASDNPLMDRLRRTFDARICDTNTYELFASRTAFDVATISSSAGWEGRLFGKPAAIFNEDILRWINAGPISMHCYDDSRFWAGLLQSTLETRQIAGPGRQPATNRLRRQVGGYAMQDGIWEDDIGAADGVGVQR